MLVSRDKERKKMKINNILMLKKGINYKKILCFMLLKRPIKKKKEMLIYFMVREK